MDADSLTRSATMWSDYGDRPESDDTVLEMYPRPNQEALLTPAPELLAVAPREEKRRATHRRRRERWASQRDLYAARSRARRLSRLWLLLPVLTAVAVVAFICWLLFVPLLTPSRRRRGGAARRGGVADNVTTVGDDTAADLAALLSSTMGDDVIELMPAHFWRNSSVLVASLMVRSAASSNSSQEGSFS
ncbi:uncharacterized protein LOC144112467 [Amblyomma americanum]